MDSMLTLLKPWPIGLTWLTKSNYNTVKNNIGRCEEPMECDMSFPWDTRKTLTFLAFLLFTRKVKAKTANCQLSGVRMAHLELGLDSPSLRPPIVELLLKGTEHWESVSAVLKSKELRAPVTIEIMLAMKRKLHESDWTLDQKFLFWSVCTLLWAGSMRVHEALSRNQLTFDPQTTLLGKDVELLSTKVGLKMRDLIRITIKSPKEDRVGNGAILEIFGNDSFLCPVKAMNHYISQRGGRTTLLKDKPFFLQDGKKGYTGQVFNSHLREMTADN